MLFPGPSLFVLDPGDDFVQRLDVESLVDPLGPAGKRIRPVQHDVKMEIVRILVQSVEALVVLHPELTHQNVHGLLYMLGGGPFPLPPGENVVFDGIVGPDRLFGEGDHFGFLGKETPALPLPPPP